MIESKERQIYIFLDFDGVMHGFSSSENFNRDNELLFLINFIKSFARVSDINQEIKINIVFSTSHRYHKNVEQLIKDISHSIDFRSHVNNFDVTGYDKHIIYRDNHEPKIIENRYYEIMAYIKKHNIDFHDFIVLDDLIDLFKVYLLDNNNQIQSFCLDQQTVKQVENQEQCYGDNFAYNFNYQDEKFMVDYQNAIQFANQIIIVKDKHGLTKQDACTAIAKLF